MTVERVIAIDWSGDAKHASEKIWVAVVEEGVLTELRNGRSPSDIVGFLDELATNDPSVIVGFDFAFSFPCWFAETFGTAQDVWAAIGKESFPDWRNEVPPFFGTTNPQYAGSGTQWRLTDLAMRSKSVFKVSGVGSVGTGSIRGMPILTQLSSRGFSIWPFMPPALPLVVEIYPRACLVPERARNCQPRFSKTNPLHRRQYFAEVLSGVWLDLATSTEDAFDAATAALAMWDGRHDLESLREITEETLLREGIIWSPRWRTVHAEWLRT